MNIIGELSRLGGDKIQIVEFDNQLFFCADTAAFAAASNQHKNAQKILRVINKTIFTPKGTVELYAFNAEQKDTLSAIQTPGTDENLLAIIKMCEGADNADVETFLHCKHVELIRELPEMGSDLSAGLGFPGRGFGLIVAQFDTRRVYLQIVHSYSEGYSVEHQQLTPEIYALAHLPGIEKILYT